MRFEWNKNEVTFGHFRAVVERGREWVTWDAVITFRYQPIYTLKDITTADEARAWCERRLRKIAAPFIEAARSEAIMQCESIAREYALRAARGEVLSATDVASIIADAVKALGEEKDEV